MRHRWLTLIIGITAAGFLVSARGQESNKADNQNAAHPGASPTSEAPPPAKWDSRISNIFFPDAREALVGERPNYSAGDAKDKPAPGETSAEPGSENAGGSVSWSKLISPQTLQDEVKTLGQLLADDVKTRQTFIGGDNKKARQSLSQLAAIFAIVSEYDGNVKWKDQAAAARDLFARAGYNCKAATDNTFNEAKACSDDVAALVRGGKIKPPTNVQPKTEWGKVSDLKQLMNRLELAQRDHISTWTANAADMKSNAAALAHETEIVAALAAVIRQPGFDNADDDKYRQFAQALQQSAVTLREAVKKNDYDAANQAAGTLSKACANCHAAFRD